MRISSSISPLISFVYPIAYLKSPLRSERKVILQICENFLFLQPPSNLFFFPNFPILGSGFITPPVAQASNLEIILFFSFLTYKSIIISCQFYLQNICQGFASSPLLLLYINRRLYLDSLEPFRISQVLQRSSLIYSQEK